MLMDLDGDQSHYKLDTSLLDHDDRKEKYHSKHLAHLTPEEILERRRLQNRKSKQKRRSEFHTLNLAKKSNEPSLIGSKVIKPKRSPSGYQLFTMDNAQLIKQQHPGLPFNEVLAIIGRNWKNAPEEVREPYLDKATKMYNEYVKDLEEYHIAVARAGINREEMQLQQQQQQQQQHHHHHHQQHMSSDLDKHHGLLDANDSDDYRHSSMQPTMLDTRIVVESEYVEALKAENMRLMEENSELKRILAQHQASVEDISMDLQPLQVHYSDSNDDDLIAMDSKSLSKLNMNRISKKQKLNEE